MYRIHSEARELNQLRYSIPLYVHLPRHFSTRKPCNEWIGVAKNASTGKFRNSTDT